MKKFILIFLSNKIVDYLSAHLIYIFIEYFPRLNKNQYNSTPDNEFKQNAPWNINIYNINSQVQSVETIETTFTNMRTTVPKVPPR